MDEHQAIRKVHVGLKELQKVALEELNEDDDKEKRRVRARAR